MLRYDFYFKGKFIKSFDSYAKAKKLVTWNENLTHPNDLYEIKTVQVFETNKKKGKNYENRT